MSSVSDEEGSLRNAVATSCQGSHGTLDSSRDASDEIQIQIQEFTRLISSG